jgi:hypothetical protein
MHLLRARRYESMSQSAVSLQRISARRLCQWQQTDARLGARAGVRLLHWSYPRRGNAPRRMALDVEAAVSTTLIRAQLW